MLNTYTDQQPTMAQNNTSSDELIRVTRQKFWNQHEQTNEERALIQNQVLSDPSLHFTALPNGKSHGPHGIDPQKELEAKQLISSGEIEGIDASLKSTDTYSQLNLTSIMTAGVSTNGRTRVSHYYNVSEMRASSSKNYPIMKTLKINADNKRKFIEQHNEQSRADMTLQERVMAANSECDIVVGHGSPFSPELFHENTIAKASPILRQLDQNANIIFVPSDSSRYELKNISDALSPGTYMYFQDCSETFESLTDNATSIETKKEIVELNEALGANFLIGGYKTSPGCPGQIFFSHVKIADLAPHILLLDSITTGHKAFPHVLGLADKVARSYQITDLDATLSQELVKSGEPFLSLSERLTRPR